MSLMGKQQPFGGCVGRGLLDPLGASPGSGPTLWGGCLLQGLSHREERGEKLHFSSAGLREPKL